MSLLIMRTGAYYILDRGYTVCYNKIGMLRKEAGAIRGLRDGRY